MLNESKQIFMTTVELYEIDRECHFNVFFTKNKTNTGGPRYSPFYYLRIRLFTYEILARNAKFLVKMCLFICEFSICGPK
jgi:hypothetical protein